MKYIKFYETYHSDTDQLNYTNSSTNFILYHRSNGIDGKDIKQAFNEGFKPGGGGNMYGKGLYGTYDIESQLRDGMYKYGDYIIECKIENTGKFIIFDSNLCKLSLKEQLKKVFGHHKYKIFYSKNKDVIEECEQLIKDKNYSNTALKMKGLKGFIQNVDGILFYGGLNDGNVIVVYNLDLINLSRYTIENTSNRFQSYNKIKWKPLKNIIGYKLNNLIDKNELNKNYLDSELFTRKEIENNIIFIELSDDTFNKLADTIKTKHIEYSIKNDRKLTQIQLNHYFKTHNTINGHLDLSYTDITSLPDNLTVGGNLNLSNSKITTLPNNLTVNGNINFHYSKITTLPNNFTVGGDLRLSNTNITSLPDNLTVGGNLHLSKTNITSLPNNLTVGGYLDLYKTNITSLPNNLTVGGDLQLSYSGITTLPDNLTVGGNLRLSYTKLTSLPNNLKVGGDLWLSHTKITSLPNNLIVGGDLWLSDTNITSLPDDLKVGGKIIR